MKDKQIAASSAEPRIFFVSALLHCVSMTALVYLRSSFGFAYLRPRSVFFAFSWAFVLYAIYAWHEDGVWQERQLLLLFGCSAVLLYWTHAVTAFYREWNGDGEHDHYSGTSHLIWLMRRSGQASATRFEANLHLWGEPGIVFLLAGASRLIFGAQALSDWLLIVAVCFWTKEALNHWFRIRQHKRQKDIFADTVDTVEPPTTTNLAPEPSKATRKAKVKRTRSKGEEADVDATEK